MLEIRYISKIYINEISKEYVNTITDAQKKAGNYRKKHIKLYGFDISIENPAGTYRSGTDSDGKKWKQKIYYDYGDIKGTEGKDGDNVDVFVGPEKASEIVFVVNQLNSKGKFDEHKVMINFNTKEEATKAYLKNYEKGWNKFSDAVPLTIDQFKEWIKNRNTKKPCEGEIK